MKSVFWVSSFAILSLLGATTIADARTSQKLAHLTDRKCQDSLEILHSMRTELYQRGFDNFLVRESPQAGSDEANALNGWQGQTPADELIHRWFRQPPPSIARCIRGSSFIGRPVVTAEAEKRMRAVAKPNSSDMFIRISSPVFARSGQRALLFYLSEGVSIGGRGQFYYLERTGDGWHVIGRRVLWVS